MLPSTKQKSVVNLLRNRELNIKTSPYFTSLNIVRQLLRSECSLIYTNLWTLNSSRPIEYEDGKLYLNDFTKFCKSFGVTKAPSSYLNLQNSHAGKKISDVIPYSFPQHKNLDEFCECRPSQKCLCLTHYLLTLSEDSWLCQYKVSDGRLIREIYAGRFGRSTNFKYCNWDIDSERFVLTSTLNACPKGNPGGDVIVYVAVFTIPPIEFFALLEITRSVFGKNCSAANIADQHLMIAVGSCQIRIYSFEALLNSGKRTPYKIGENFLNGRIGYFPIGLPLNFQYDEPPPILFDVRCGAQAVRFGGHPYHFIFKSTKGDNMCVKNLLTNKVASNGEFRSSGDSPHDPLETLTFHPDRSNRLVFTTDESVRCYKIVSDTNGDTRLSPLFSMDFVDRKIYIQHGISSYGRKIKRLDYAAFDQRCIILATDYERDLDIFAILGALSPGRSNGFVKLFDGTTGELVRTVELKRQLSDSKVYQLLIDMGCILVFEKALPSEYVVIVCNL